MGDLFWEGWPASHTAHGLFSSIPTVTTVFFCITPQSNFPAIARPWIPASHPASRGLHPWSIHALVKSIYLFMPTLRQWIQMSVIILKVLKMLFKIYAQAKVARPLKVRLSLRNCCSWKRRWRSWAEIFAYSSALFARRRNPNIATSDTTKLQYILRVSHSL